MKVIIGVDNSPYSDAAIRYISEAIWPKGTSVLAISAMPPLLILPGEALAPEAIAKYVGQQEQSHKRVAERAAQRLSEAGLDTKGVVKQGDPRTVLEETARSEQADLIVVGSHGRSGIKKLILGSVADHVVAHAPCPVLVVKIPAWRKEEKAEEQGSVAASRA
jgi:nucleotide-binding universal stress UspA family protein